MFGDTLTIEPLVSSRWGMASRVRRANLKTFCSNYQWCPSIESAHFDSKSLEIADSYDWILRSCVASHSEMPMIFVSSTIFAWFVYCFVTKIKDIKMIYFKLTRTSIFPKFARVNGTIFSRNDSSVMPPVSWNGDHYENGRSTHTSSTPSSVEPETWHSRLVSCTHKWSCMTEVPQGKHTLRSSELLSMIAILAPCSAKRIATALPIAGDEPKWIIWNFPYNQQYTGAYFVLTLLNVVKLQDKKRTGHYNNFTEEEAHIFKKKVDQYVPEYSARTRLVTGECYQALSLKDQSLTLFSCICILMPHTKVCVHSCAENVVIWHVNAFTQRVHSQETSFRAVTSFRESGPKRLILIICNPLTEGTWMHTLTS